MKIEEELVTSIMDGPFLIQMIFVELSAHIDRGFPPSPINGTGMVLAFVNSEWVCRAIYW